MRRHKMTPQADLKLLKATFDEIKQMLHDVQCYEFDYRPELERLYKMWEQRLKEIHKKGSK